MSFKLSDLIRVGKFPNRSLYDMGAVPKGPVRGAPKKKGKFYKKFRPGLRSVELAHHLNKPPVPKNKAIQSKKIGAGLVHVGPGRQPVNAYDKSHHKKGKRVGRVAGEMGTLHDFPIVMGDGTNGDWGTTPDPSNPDTTPDTSYHPNGTVWVTEQAIQLFTRRQGGVKPLLYPDGTPVTSRMWLPGMDLTAYLAPYIPSWIDRGTQKRGPIGALVPANNQLAILVENLYSAWDGKPEDFTPFVNSQGYCNLWGWSQDDKGNWGFIIAVKEGDEQNYFLYSYLDGSRGIYQGRTDYGYSGLNSMGAFNSWAWPWDLNWVDHSPDRSYIFSKLWMPGAENATWIQMPADLYNVNGKSVDQQTPWGLPGFAWMGLDVLNALRLGAHGLPKLIKDDGTLDGAALGQFIAQNADWGPVLDLDPWGTGASMLATIYDTSSSVQAGVSAAPLPPPSSVLDSPYPLYGDGQGGVTVPPPPPYYADPYADYGDGGGSADSDNGSRGYQYAEDTADPNLDPRENDESVLDADLSVEDL